MAMIDLARVEKELWPGPIRGLGLLATFRRPDYRALCLKAVHDGAVIAVSAQRLRRLAAERPERPRRFDSLDQYLETAFSAVQVLRDLAAWYGKFGWKDKETIIYRLDEWQRCVGPEFSQGWDAHSVLFDDVLRDMDEATEKRTAASLVSVTEDPEFDIRHAQLWEACLADGDA
jgi:hypothetical protein